MQPLAPKLTTLTCESYSYSSSRRRERRRRRESSGSALQTVQLLHGFCDCVLEGPLIAEEREYQQQQQQQQQLVSMREDGQK
jgi:hypothetical protein